jgi:hypothetical protein
VPLGSRPTWFSVRIEVIMQHPAWSLVLIGAVIAGIGLIWLFGPSIPWLGRLPGDIAIDRENFHFYFPITTCFLLSVVLSGIAWLVRYFFK